MALSCLIPVTGFLKQMPLETSLFLGALLFLTSFGSYLAKNTEMRFFSWVAYTLFGTVLLSLWDQYVTTVSIISNGKIAACVAVIAFLLKFRTYAITFAMLSLWAQLLWKVKQLQSIAVLQNILSFLHSEYLYIAIFIVAFLVGGLIGKMFTSRKESNRNEKTTKAKAKKKRHFPRISIPIPRISLPRFSFKRFGRKKKNVRKNETSDNSENSRMSRMYRVSEEIKADHSSEMTEQTDKQMVIEPKTRMERLRLRE